MKAYEIGRNSIVLKFCNGKAYEYTYSSAGFEAVEAMKECAIENKGLNRYIDRYKPAYAGVFKKSFRIEHFNKKQKQIKSKSTAALLAFFLGGVGMHRFYLGQTGLGVVYLLFFWTLIPAVAAFVDFIIFLTVSDEKFNAKYNKKLKSTSLESIEEQVKYL
ncbi:MAG: hypothetical protein JWO58_598 [Chitinophagaceae bacterium]|nr:hypothetical protein [Chitinophagaceae bacterium]